MLFLIKSKCFGVTFRGRFCLCFANVFVFVFFCIWTTWGDVPWQEEVYKYASKSGLAKFPSASIQIPISFQTNPSCCFQTNPNVLGRLLGMWGDLPWQEEARAPPYSQLHSTALLYMHKYFSKFLQICVIICH